VSANRAKCAAFPPTDVFFAGGTWFISHSVAARQAQENIEGTYSSNQTAAEKAVLALCHLTLRLLCFRPSSICPLKHTQALHSTYATDVAIARLCIPPFRRYVQRAASMARQGGGPSMALTSRTSLRSGPGALANGQDDQDELDRLAKPTLTRRKGKEGATDSGLCSCHVVCRKHCLDPCECSCHAITVFSHCEQCQQG
jgi:hypothetical protein